MSAAHDLVVMMLLFASLALLLPVLVLLVQLLAVAPGSCEMKVEKSKGRPRIAVLMPAHDEAQGIGAALQSVLPQLRAGDRLLVVADSCNDETAAVAASNGAEVVVRNDLLQRGKGFALDFGVRYLEADPPEVLVIVDADCELGIACLDQVARLSAARQRPVQALYLMRSPPEASLRTRMAEFAWVVKNHARPLGGLRLGMPCQLMGTGMALPWALIRMAPLASGHLVEDMQLGLHLASTGTPPVFCPGARVISMFPSSAQALAVQRTRWEHGHLSLIFSLAPRLMWQALRHQQPALAAMVLDSCIPPLASLALALTVTLAATALWFILGGALVPVAVAMISTLLFGLSIALAWSRFGRQIVSLPELLSAPLYALGKLPIYIKLFTNRQAEWVRTKRDDGPR